MWVDGGNMSAPNVQRLDDLCVWIERSPGTNPSEVREWLLSPEKGSSRSRFSKLVGERMPPVLGRDRRFVDTLGSGETISAPIVGRLRNA